MAPVPHELPNRAPPNMAALTNMAGAPGGVGDGAGAPRVSRRLAHSVEAAPPVAAALWTSLWSNRSVIASKHFG
eukprot:2741474-Prymnesium_polylepis.1